jgi:hypothetical protein
MRPAQPLVADATTAPIDGAAYSSPSTPGPPSRLANAGNSASGMPKNIALMSTT